MDGIFTNISQLITEQQIVSHDTSESLKILCWNCYLGLQGEAVIEEFWHKGRGNIENLKRWYTRTMSYTTFDKLRNMFVTNQIYVLQM